MTNHLKSAVYLVVVQAFIYGTCAPIPIHYGFVGQAKTNNTTITFNSGKQFLTCQIGLYHYPSKTINTYVQVNFQNNSEDTLFFNRPISIYSNNSIVPSKKVNRFFETKASLAPYSNFRIEGSEHPNFRGNIRELVTLLKNDSVQIVLNYSIGRIDSMVQTFTLKPVLRH